jgi:pimeloyl-ACP methyl ester carboxylesterase
VDEGRFRLDDGRTIAYLESEGDRSRAIVLVHGGGDNAATWHGLVPPLSALGRVIAPDLAGHGRSDDAPLDGPPTFHHDVDVLLGHLGLDVPPVLVGHSLGAAVVLALAKLRPASGIVLLDGAPHRGILEPELTFDAAAYEERMRAIGIGAVRTPAELDAMLGDDEHPEQVRRAHARVAEGRYERRPSVAESVRMAARGRRPDNPYLDLDLFAQVGVSTIAIQAERGNSSDVRDEVDRLLRGNPLIKSRWIDATHSLHWDRPDVVVGAVRELLER